LDLNRRRARGQRCSLWRMLGFRTQSQGANIGAERSVAARIEQFLQEGLVSHGTDEEFPCRQPRENTRLLRQSCGNELLCKNSQEREGLLVHLLHELQRAIAQIRKLRRRKAHFAGQHPRAGGAAGLNSAVDPSERQTASILNGPYGIYGGGIEAASG